MIVSVVAASKDGEEANSCDPDQKQIVLKERRRRKRTREHEEKKKRVAGPDLAPARVELAKTGFVPTLADDEQNVPSSTTLHAGNQASHGGSLQHHGNILHQWTCH